MQMLNFVRGKGEYRQVSVSKDGSYRIWAQTGMLGKRHENFEEYFQHIKTNGWRKATLYEFLKAKYA